MKRALLIICLIFAHSAISSTTSENSPIDAISTCDTAECAKQFKQIKKFAKRGSPAAQGILSAMYFSGYGVEQSSKSGETWLLKAARHGGSDYKSQLGMIYLVGENVDKDIDKGVRWLTSSADDDNAEANYLLGSMYATGFFLPKSDTKALSYLVKASELGHSEAKLLLATLYEKDESKALELYFDSAKMGNTAALEILKSLSPEKHQAAMNNDDIEIVTVTAPGVSEMLDDVVLAIKGQRVFTSDSSVGSRIAGRSCVLTGECKVYGTGLGRERYYGNMLNVLNRINPPSN